MTPKTMAVLLRLATKAGEVVRREELLAAVWPNAHVGEEVLTRAISDLRASLGDDPRRPRFIETIPKVGYRLVLAVSLNGAPPTPALVEAGRLKNDERGSSRRWTGAIWTPAAVLVSMGLLGAIFWKYQGRSDLRAPVVSPPAGVSAAPLTTLPGFESWPELSPDGRDVSFTWSGPDQDNGDIWVVSIDGGEPRRVTTDPAAEAGATWSPDGLRLAFARYRKGSCEIYEIALSGGPERLLGSCGRNGTADLVWSPDGEWIAFSDRENDDESFGIYLLSTLTGERRKVVAPDGQHWGDRDPSFSPDGRQLAFTRSVSMETNDVYRVSIDGGEPVPVTADGRPIRGHVWSQDGSAVIVSSRRTAARGLWRYPLDGTSATWLPIQAGHPWRPSLSGSREHLVFENRVLETEIRRLALRDDALHKTWLETTQEDLDPQHSPDGRQVAFATNRSGFFEIWTAPSAGGEPRQLTALGASFTGGPRWSPDGGTIVFDSRLDGQADIYAIDADGGASRRLTDHSANDLAASFSADGRWIYFGSNRTGRWQIWRRPVGSGKARQMTRTGGYRALESTDGAWLYFTKFGRSGLFGRWLADGSESRAELRVPGTEGLIGHQHWTVADDGVYLLIATEDGAQLVRIAADRIEVLHDLGGESVMAGLSVAPGSASVLFCSIARLESDLWHADWQTLLAGFPTGHR